MRKNTNLPFVSVIFPNYNGGEKTLECIKSLNQLNYPQEKFEIIMVDNSSSDGSLEAVEKTFENLKSLKIIKSNKNLGAPKAYNLAIKNSNPQAKYFFKLDNDIILDKEALLELVKFMESHPEAGGTGPKIYYYSEPNLLSGIGYRMGKFFGNAIFVGLKEEDTGQYEAPQEFECMIGCASLFRKEAMKKAGFFNPKYLVYFDDAELFIKINKAGYKNYYVPEAKVWHNTKINVSQSPFSSFNFMRSKVIFIKEISNPFQYALFILVQIFGYLPFKAIVNLVKKQKDITSAQISGFISGIKANHFS